MPFMSDDPYRTPPPALAPPPRHVPFRLRAAVLLGRKNAIAWLALIAALVLSAVVLPDVRWMPRHYDRRASGRVSNVEMYESESHGKHGHHSAARYVIDAEFVDEAGVAHRARSYGAGPPAFHEVVEVEYEHDAPGHARVVGWPDSKRDRGVGLLIALLDVIAAAACVFTVLRASRHVRLLREGIATTGRLVDRQEVPSNVTVNGKNVPRTRLTFEYEAELERVHRHVVELFRPGVVTDDAAEPMLYDPHRHDRAVLLHTLPGRPHVERDGSLRARAFHGYELLLPVTAAALVVITLLRV